jgi:flagellar L-ring protein precursor FlgH
MNRLISILPLTVFILTGCVASKPVLKADPAYAPVKPRAINHSDIPVTKSASGSIYQAATSVSIYEDYKAARVGDILTIVLQESTNASKSAATSTSKEDDIDIAAPALMGATATFRGNELSASSSAAREFDGEGSSTQSNSLTGRISVTVVEVMHNGNMKVRGEKLLHLNQGDEYIRISGIVRQVDVQANNTVPSNLVANAKITYGGNGALAEANSQGWLSRFFSSVLWPF